MRWREGKRYGEEGKEEREGWGRGKEVGEGEAARMVGGRGRGEL